MSNEALVRTSGLFLAIALVFGAVALSGPSVLAQALAAAALALSGLTRLLAASAAEPPAAAARARWSRR